MQAFGEPKRASAALGLGEICNKGTGIKKPRKKLSHNLLSTNKFRSGIHSQKD